MPPSQQGETNLVENAKDIFVDPSIIHFMGTSDHIKLQGLVTTAQPKQITSWHSPMGSYFEFKSKQIFVNAKGQGCRNYQIKMKRGFFEHHVFNYTACRDSQGDWQVVKSAQ